MKKSVMLGFLGTVLDDGFSQDGTPNGDRMSMCIG